MVGIVLAGGGKVTAQHSPETVTALIRLPWIGAHERKVLIGAAATLRRARPLSDAQERVVGRIMRQAMRDDDDWQPVGDIARRIVEDYAR